MKTAAVIVAAGRSSRMHSEIPKQYLSLSGKPVLCYSVEAFQKAGADRIVVVVSPGEIEHCRTGVLAPFGLADVVMTEGGKERHDSVYQGLLKAEGCDYVWIHDGARPLVTEEILRRTLAAAVEGGACVAAMPVKDTIKEADGAGFVAGTPDRSRLWAVQTPQTFAYDTIRAAHEARLRDNEGGAPVTDDGMLVERYLRLPVKLVEGSYRNLKITTEEDLILAEALLRGRN
ncbi:MAG: 2-C-methyl-D-erythritol 4-phosphate cytidylyltransferase [Lachnospiraceae bacterium]|nr:2-C-methyl-D-erythritol 4-phosphate cytidylyltransferase [Lachnospiraceae bacterium]